MENNRFNKALQEIQSISMSTAEKQAMRDRIMADAVAGRSSVPVPAAPIKSIWTVYSFGGWIGSHRRATAVVALLVIILGSRGLISISENSLPGDTLYSMKVNVAEPLQLAVTTDPIAKAEVQTEFLQKRFEEVETLAVRNKLDETTKKTVTARVDKQVADLNTGIQKVENVSSDKADDVSSTLEASIRAHQRVLAEIDARKAIPQTTSRQAKVVVRAPVVPNAPLTRSTDTQTTVPTVATMMAPAAFVAPAVNVVASSTDSREQASSTNSTDSDKRTRMDRGRNASSTRAFERKTRQKEEEFFKKAQERLNKEEGSEEIRKHN